MPDPLSERDWRDLLRRIHNRQVIPVVGPSLATVVDPATGERVPLRRHLAPALARGLGLENPESFVSWNDVARAHLLGGGKRERVYDELRALLDQVRADPPPALLALASITDFDLFISSTPDSLLAQALTRQRPGFSPARDVIRFHPRGLPGDRATCPRTSPARSCTTSWATRTPTRTSRSGKRTTWSSSAACSKRRIRWRTSFASSRAAICCFWAPRRRTGSSASSCGWRASSGCPSCDQHDYLADQPASLGDPMILFFDQAVKATRVIAGPPAEFVQTLERAWRERYGAAGSDEEFLQRMPAEIPRGAVFLSYSRDDLSAAVKLARALEAAGVPVWMDKLRLEAGASYERSLQHEVKDACSFFVSLISRATEADPARYVHRERAWAAQRHVDGFVFYVPLVLDLDETTPPRLEPECFRQSHSERWNDATLGNFVLRVRKLVDEFRSAGRPRG